MRAINSFPTITTQLAPSRLLRRRRGAACYAGQQMVYFTYSPSPAFAIIRIERGRRHDATAKSCQHAIAALNIDERKRPPSVDLFSMIYFTLLLSLLLPTISQRQGAYLRRHIDARCHYLETSLGARRRRARRDAPAGDKSIRRARHLIAPHFGMIALPPYASIFGERAAGDCYSHFTAILLSLA